VAKPQPAFRAATSFIFRRASRLKKGAVGTDTSGGTAPVTVPSVTGLSAGIWEHTAGVSTDVEVDEVFVVLAGRATIEVEGGPTLEVGPGDLGVLEAGARTRWVVHEDLRKVFACPAT
jgi:uncharacterized cupin superfamily protein